MLDTICDGEIWIRIMSTIYHLIVSSWLVLEWHIMVYVKLFNVNVHRALFYLGKFTISVQHWPLMHARSHEGSWHVKRITIEHHCYTSSANENWQHSLSIIGLSFDMFRCLRFVRILKIMGSMAFVLAFFSTRKNRIQTTRYRFWKLDSSKSCSIMKQIGISLVEIQNMIIHWEDLKTLQRYKATAKPKFRFSPKQKHFFAQNQRLQFRSAAN